MDTILKVVVSLAPLHSENTDTPKIWRIAFLTPRQERETQCLLRSLVARPKNVDLDTKCFWLINNDQPWFLWWQWKEEIQSYFYVYFFTLQTHLSTGKDVHTQYFYKSENIAKNFMKCKYFLLHKDIWVKMFFNLKALLFKQIFKINEVKTSILISRWIVI